MTAKRDDYVAISHQHRGNTAAMQERLMVSVSVDENEAQRVILLSVNSYSSRGYTVTCQRSLLAMSPDQPAFWTSN